MRSTYAQLCQPSVFNGVLQDAVYIYIVSIWVFQEHYEYCHYIRTDGGNWSEIIEVVLQSAVYVYDSVCNIFPCWNAGGRLLLSVYIVYF
jgi:hypothetical protein